MRSSSAPAGSGWVGSREHVVLAEAVDAQAHPRTQGHAREHVLRHHRVEDHVVGRERRQDRPHQPYGVVDGDLRALVVVVPLAPGAVATDVDPAERRLGGVPLAELGHQPFPRGEEAARRPTRGCRCRAGAAASRAWRRASSPGTTPSPGSRTGHPAHGPGRCPGRSRRSRRRRARARCASRRPGRGSRRRWSGSPPARSTSRATRTARASGWGSPARTSGSPASAARPSSASGRGFGPHLRRSSLSRPTGHASRALDRCSGSRQGERDCQSAQRYGARPRHGGLPSGHTRSWDDQVRPASLREADPSAQRNARTGGIAG